MSTPTDRSSDLLARMGTAAVPVRVAAERQAQRARLVPAIDIQAARVLERRTLQARWSRRWAALAVAAAVALVAGGWWLSARPSTVAEAPAHYGHVQMIQGLAKVVRPGQSETRVASSFDVDPRDVVMTLPGARARLQLAERVQVELGGETQVQLAEPTRGGRETVGLSRGHAAFAVQPLPVGTTFSVSTHDAEIIVHGTRFAVTAGSHTTVEVTEGVVSVVSGSRTVRLLAGQRWSSATGERSATLEEGSSSKADPVAAPGLEHRAPVAVVPGSGGSPATSTLSAESREFLAAMAAKRSGRDSLALERLEAFLVGHPKSPLAQEAQVERFRLLKRLGRDRAAATEARRYMAEHPDGFARGEARDLVMPASVGSTEPP